MFKTEKKQIVAIVFVAVATCIIGLSALIMAGVSVQTKQATVLGLFDGEGELTVEKITPPAVDDEVEIFAYDFSLSTGQPVGAIEIVIPYNDKGLSEEEEILAVCGKYLNEETGEWENVHYTVDAEQNQVHIFTNHLSTYSVFKVNNPNKRSAYISDVNVYAFYMKTSKAQEVLNAYGNQASGWEEDVAGSLLSASDTLSYFAATNIQTLLSLGGAYDDMFSTPFSKGMTSLGVATACAQFAYDAYNNGLTSQAASISGMKSVLSLCLNFASPAVQLAYVGVGVIDIALTEVSSFAIQTKYESTKNMYDAYYKRPENARKIRDWYTIFDTFYKDKKNSPQMVLDKITQEINTYVNRFWDVAATDWESWIDSYDKNGILSKYPLPSKADQSNISANYKAELYDYLQGVFRKISLNLYLDGLETREAEFNAIATMLNRKYSINISEELIENKTPVWANCYVRLSPLKENTKVSDWTIKLNDKAVGKMEFSLLGHQMAGFPMKLEFFKTKTDLEDNKPAATKTLSPFKSTQKSYTIKAKTQKIDWSGTYIGTCATLSNGNEYDITTVVTFVSDTDDGTYYKIVCTNNKTNAIYINNNYYVRWSTGEANISGYDFTFSSDGNSFFATQKDINGNAVATFSGQKS
jgi:hypothetical protein